VRAAYELRVSMPEARADRARRRGKRGRSCRSRAENERKLERRRFGCSRNHRGDRVLVIGQYLDAAAADRARGSSMPR
jgi:hypothetical protein